MEKVMLKPTLFDAVQYGADTLDTIKAMDDHMQVKTDTAVEPLALRTPKGVMNVMFGDWILRAESGDLYVETPRDFNRMYVPIEAAPAPERNEVTSPEVASVAARILKDPEASAEAKTVAASALTQSPDRPKKAAKKRAAKKAVKK